MRQISLRGAFDDAARLHTVYLAAGAGAIALPDRDGSRPRAPLVVATVVAVGGLLSVVHALLPGADGACFSR